MEITVGVSPQLRVEKEGDMRGDRRVACIFFNKLGESQI